MFDADETRELFRVWGDVVTGEVRRQHAVLEHDLTRALWSTSADRWGHLVVIERDGLTPPTVACTWPNPLPVPSP